MKFSIGASPVGEGIYPSSYSDKEILSEFAPNSSFNKVFLYFIIGYLFFKSIDLSVSSERRQFQYTFSGKYSASCSKLRHSFWLSKRNQSTAMIMYCGLG